MVFWKIKDDFMVSDNSIRKWLKYFNMNICNMDDDPFYCLDFSDL